MRSHRRLAALIGLTFALSGSAVLDGCHARRARPPAARGGGPAQAGDLDDASIGGLAGVIHSSVIEQSEVAQYRGDDERVQVFADRMIDRHATAGQALRRVLSRERVEPELTALGRQLVNESAASMRAMTGLRGVAFDRAYMESQIRVLERAASLYDESIVPQADDGDVRAVVTRDRDAIRRQLEEARGILAALPAVPVAPEREATVAGRDVSAIGTRGIE